MRKLKIGYDVASENTIMFEMKRSGAGNKWYLIKMNPNPLLGQGIIIRDILAHVWMFSLCRQFHEPYARSISSIACKTQVYNIMS